MKAQGIQQLPYQLVNSRPLSLDSTLTSYIFGAMPTSTAGSVRYRPYMDRDVAPINGQTRFSDYEVRNSSAYSCKNSQQRTAGEWYNQHNYDHAGPYMGYDHSYLSTLRSLQEVCSIGTTINEMACLSDTSMSSISPPHGKHNPDAVASAIGSVNSVTGSTNCEHPFYARRSAASPAECMTRTRDKYRVVYTDKQRKGLERAYDEDKFITMEARDKLSKELELSDRQIKIWFQNRRAKERRDTKRTSDESNISSGTDTSDSTDISDNSGSSMTSSRTIRTTERVFQTSQCRYKRNMDPFPSHTNISPSDVTTTFPRISCNQLSSATGWNCFLNDRHVSSDTSMSPIMQLNSCMYNART